MSDDARGQIEPQLKSYQIYSNIIIIKIIKSLLTVNSLIPELGHSHTNDGYGKVILRSDMSFSAPEVHISRY